MQLRYAKIKSGNFGDDLNPWLWEQLIHNLINDNKEYQFLGIGTILHNKIPSEPNKILFGSGGGYRPPPIIDNKWNIYCVRGPLTAKLLKINKSYAIADPAYLVRSVSIPDENKEYNVSFIPHYSSDKVIEWKDICDRAGIHYISPRDSVEATLAQIQKSKLVIAEAMHGAIVADALRIPWIPLKCSYKFLDFKWIDWCKSVSIQYEAVTLPPILQKQLNFRKMSTQAIKRNLNKVKLGKKKWSQIPYRLSTPTDIDKIVQIMQNIPLNFKPFLSSDATVNSVTQRLQEKIVQLKKDFEAGLIK